MKYFLLINTVSFLLSMNSILISQTDMDMVDKIIEQVEKIQSDTKLKTVTLRNDEFMEHMTDGGGELTGFYKEDNIYRVNQKIGISYGIYITEFFYEDNNLIFVSEKFNQYNYDSLNSFDYTKTTTAFNGIYYFQNGKVVYSTSAGHNRFEEDNADPAKYYSDESERNLVLIRKKNEVKKKAFSPHPIL